MKLLIAIVGSVTACMLSMAQPQISATASRFSNPQHVFTLRAEVLAGRAQAFDKGALLAAANQVESAQEQLQSAIDTSQDLDEAYEARDLLANMYVRNGMYQQAQEEIEAALRLRPQGGDAKSMLPLTKALSALPPTYVVSFQPTKLRIGAKSKALPLKLNGQDASFLFDTGANISVIGESEAKSLGLKTAHVNGTMGDSSGIGVSNLRVALAKDLVIGGLHLKNVPFLVLDDRGEPWKSMPPNKRGIVGIPVLLAMRTIRWNPKGSFSFGFPSEALDLSNCNVLFSNSTPVVAVQVDGKPLEFTLDTGAVSTDLNPAFATSLPELTQSGKLEEHSIEGLGGKTVGASVVLPAVRLAFGGGEAVLKQAHVFTEHGNGTWAEGNMGTDVLSQGSGFRLDFRAMKLHLD